MTQSTDNEIKYIRDLLVEIKFWLLLEHWRLRSAHRRIANRFV